MSKKSIYTDVAGKSGPAPKKNPGFGKKHSDGRSRVDNSDAGRDETESIPALGQRDKKLFVMPAPSDVGRITKEKK